MENKEKKPKRVLKILGRVGEFVLEEGLKRIFKGVISRIGGKKNLPSILFLLLSFTLYGQYPATGNKQRLGYQTTADGLVWRGRASDTVSLKSSTINNAYIIIDTVNNVMFNYIKTKGGWLFNNTDTVIVNNNFTQPIDSLFFDTSVLPNNVDTAKMRWDYNLATVVLGMYDQVPNELGFKNFWLVKNQTGSTIAKGSVVYASGTVGASGRISVSKFIANGTIEPKLVLGVTAHEISNGEDGYVIDFGKIRQVNTDTFAAGAILYPSPTTAGAFTDVEPQAPNVDMPIAFCINSSYNNGTIAIRVASGYKMHEIQDVDTTGISTNEGLIYNGSYFVASNGKLLTPSDTTSLSNRINLKLNLSDTASMLTNYLRTGVAASTYLPLTGGATSGLITSSFNNSSNYSSGNTDNNGFQIYNTTSSTNNIYGGIQFFLGAAGGVIPGGEGLAQIYALRKGGVSDASTDLLFALKGVGGTLEKMRIKFDGKVGIGTSTPSYLLDVNGQIGSTGFIKSGGTSSQFLKADGTTDSNTYLTTSSAASTYLPLTGGTVTGNTNFVPTTGRVIFGETAAVWDEVLGVRPRTTSSLGLGIYSSSSSYTGSLFRAQSENSTGSQYMLYEGRGNGGSAKFWVKGDGSSFFAKNMTIGSQTNYDALNIHHSGDEGLRMSYLTEPTSYFFQIRPYQSPSNVRYVFSQTNNNIFYDSVLVLNQGNIAINKLNPSYKLDVNGTFNASGNSLIGGTLGVTGATTLSGALTVNNATVLNEGSGDYDTRIESDGNANMVFVDASTDRVGIGTNTPSKTLDVNGEVKIATTTATPTALLGKDGSNVVGEVTTVAQTGLFTRGETSTTTGSPSAVFTVTHGLGSNPTAVMVTSAGIAGAEKIIYEVYAKNSTTFSVQAWNYDGTEAANKDVKIYWFAIK